VSTTWYAAFGLLTVLAVLNGVFLIATMRQVGVLHQRVRPIGHGQVGGPTVGARLPAVAFETVPGSPELTRRTPLTVLAYIAPGCDVCDDLLPVLHAYRRSARDDEIELALVTEAASDDAQVYLTEHRVGLPFVRHDNIARLFKIPGSPFLLAVTAVTAGSFTVLASGVVNTMEQLEDLVQTAHDNVDALATQAHGTPLQVAPANGSGGHGTLTLTTERRTDAGSQQLGI
jgi:methylamine dehydrogenase accessory protein MauD